ncbi:olfactory receptor 6C2-like [Cricetulus griseus]|uniref:Olfactory receptor n=1 Tax=Cricetulus griseus TaxID=10029 RepID=A0A9J7F5J0_CRIGR|nr:olfactory receptor 6C2-like [Cricetulus griseus]XP_027247696.1 olfactory receptor 6C2-like [Cricetulus griseus]
MRNRTVTTFILLGLTDDTRLKILLFIFLFLSYTLSLSGNITIITLTLADPRLKTPMYILLKNFSFLEILLTTSCIPRFLYSISSGDKSITYIACFTQLLFIDIFAVTEFFLLAIMSYDRYVAICKPLHYMTIMNSRACRNFILFCWVAALMIVLPPVSLGLGLEFCDSNLIDHFCCDAAPLLKISCSDTQLVEQMVIADAVLAFITTFMCVILSYIYIIRTILRFPSAKQRKKAFSTCSSHMIVVSITYGSCIFIYIKPSSKDDVAINKGISLLIISISPMLNPFIYALRNKQVKQAFNYSIKKLHPSQRCKIN